MNFQNNRSVFQTPKNLNRRDRIQVLSKGCEMGFCWETAEVHEFSELCTPQADCVQGPDNCTLVVSVMNPGNFSGERRLQVLSLARVAEFEWENSSEIPIEGLCVSISTRKRDQLSSFTEVIERFEVCSFNNTMKTTVHHKGVMKACRSVSEEFQELEGSSNLTLGHENQTCSRESELRTRLEKSLPRVEDARPEDEDGGETVPVP